MKGKAVSGIMLILLFFGVLPFVFDVQPVKASETIYIRVDGSIEGTANITTVDNVTYYFTDNNYDSIVIQRNNIVVDGAGYTLQGTGSGTGIDLSSRNNVTVKNTEIKAFGCGINLEGSSGNTISGNNITSSGFNVGIELSFSNDNTISGNTVKFGAACLILRFSNFTTISGNNLINPMFNCISILTSCYNNITENYVTHASGGISIKYSSYNIISGNTVTANHIAGITLRNGSYNFISGNIVTNNGDELGDWDPNLHGVWANASGIHLRNSPSNTISGNTVTGNKFYGISIEIEFYSNTTISNNNLTGNIVSGIHLLGHSDSFFYHNNLDNNTFQVLNYGSTDIWDNGYPSGGNYWSNYTGIDLKNGPNQNQAGSDGIGDTPHVIDENNTDNYPLMNPWAPTETSINMMGIDYPVTIVSNTTIDKIVGTIISLHFKSSGPEGEKGYINIIFPMVNTTEIKVFIDDNKLTPPPFPVINSNGTHYFIYFEFTLSTHTIDIEFTSLVPAVGGIYIPTNKLELLTPYLGLTLLLAVAVATVVYAKKRKRNRD